MIGAGESVLFGACLLASITGENPNDDNICLGFDFVHATVSNVLPRCVRNRLFWLLIIDPIRVYLMSKGKNTHTIFVLLR